MEIQWIGDEAKDLLLWDSFELWWCGMTMFGNGIVLGTKMSSFPHILDHPPKHHKNVCLDNQQSNIPLMERNCL